MVTKQVNLERAMKNKVSRAITNTDDVVWTDHQKKESHYSNVD
jgi:hypothetical protein